MLLICLRVDEDGAWPVVLEERDELACGNGVEWRFVAAVQDLEEARRLVRQLSEEHEAQRRMHAAAARSAAVRAQPSRALHSDA